ncbi:hypothetical protein [Ornithinimicrobium cavernae]|uniref:hypothetical protein n=1 Tax=Ornithinimicrobium cavernae TaxID=2666047 RepID=UPI000D68F5B3|nr:hypothetical protein [Ornithinimicrobium cavernae]
MHWYAETPARRTRQVVGDLLALAWVLLWLLIARWTFDLVRLLAAPADPLRASGTTVQRRMSEVAGQVGEVPLVGDRLTGPFTGAADAGGSLISAGDALDSAVTRVAWLLSVFVAAVPILVVAGAYVLLRYAWARRASELGRLRQGTHALELLALRALVHQSPRRLARVAQDPLAGWRTGDADTVRALADLELGRLGLRAGPQRGG